MNTQDFYKLVDKWRPLPPFGFKFMHGAKCYEIVGVVQAGNKVRAEGEDGKIYLFPVKGFARRYGCVDNT